MIRFFSLDEARSELKSRKADLNLKQEIENELGDNFISAFGDSQKAIMWKAVMSPDHSLDFFLSCAAYLNIQPLFFEHLGDKFTSLNEEKKNLARLFLKNESRGNSIYDICNVQENENKPISEVTLRNGQLLVDFYRELFIYSKYQCPNVDLTNWAKSHGRADDYYYNYLLHFVHHGAAFELFLSDDPDEAEVRFTNEVIVPKIEKIKSKYGYDPIIIKPYPSNQTNEEDFYWWSFNPLLNAQLLETCVSNNFNIKK